MTSVPRLSTNISLIISEDSVSSLILRYVVTVDTITGIIQIASSTSGLNGTIGIMVNLDRGRTYTRIRYVMQMMAPIGSSSLSMIDWLIRLWA